MLVFSGKYSCCRRLLRVPWSTRRSNQRILKEIIPEYSLEALMKKLKLQRHDVDRIRSRVGKIKGRMWVGSEVKVGEFGAGFV